MVMHRIESQPSVPVAIKAWSPTPLSALIDIKSPVRAAVARFSRELSVEVCYPRVRSGLSGAVSIAATVTCGERFSRLINCCPVGDESNGDAAVSRGSSPETLGG
jgi:hypothetical protein